MPLQTAAEVMTRKLITLRPDETVNDAIRLLLKHKISGAPVLQGTVLVGVLSERDCLNLLVQDLYFQQGGSRSTVRDFMTKEVITVTPTTDLFTMANIFLSKPIRRLPVLSPSRELVGQVSRRDLLKAIDDMGTPAPAPSRGAFPDFRRS